jgi:hypothetical protein
MSNPQSESMSDTVYEMADISGPKGRITAITEGERTRSDRQGLEDMRKKYMGEQV